MRVKERVKKIQEKKFQIFYAPSGVAPWRCERKTELKGCEPQSRPDNAIESIRAKLQHASRATAVMDCGTGKTLVSIWVEEALIPKMVLVLVPSLTRLSQTSPKECRQSKWGNRLLYLCVCRNARVDGSAHNEAYSLKLSDFEFTVTTQENGFMEF